MTSATKSPGGSKRRIPVAQPSFSALEERLVLEAIRSGWVTQGPMVEKFEQAVAGYTGAREAVAVTSGTAALFLSLKVLGIGPGDEVILPSLCFIAIANAVVHCGATPVFADVNPRTYNLDPDAVANAVTPRTRAILVAHQLGLPADLDRLNTLAKGDGLAVIEDAACALGARYKGAALGASGNLVCFSFHPRKVVVCGEGGMIMTSDTGLAQRLRRLRHQGMSISDLERHRASGVIIEEYPEIGYNFRLSDLCGALGLAQMERLDLFLAARREAAARYDAALELIDEIESQPAPQGAEPNYQSYIVRFPGSDAALRNRLLERMNSRGVATRRGLMAIHREACFQGVGVRGPLDETERAADQTFILPMYSELTEEDQRYVIDSLKETLAEIGAARQSAPGGGS